MLAGWKVQSRLARCLVLALLLCLAPLAAAATAAAGAPPNFSFVVLGDTRSEIFIPGGLQQAGEIRALLQKRYHSPPELSFDPDSGLLRKVRIKPRRGKKSYTAIYRDGWPQLAWRGEGAKARVIMRASGRQWIFERIAAAFNPSLAPAGRRPLFCLHTGDLVIWGGQGRAVSHSPYWQRLQQGLLARLPPPEPGLGLPGRFFPALGNHETWLDQDLKGLLTTLPYLRQMGLTPQRRIYSFRHAGCRFIFLDSGGYDAKGEGWWTDKPGFAEQMRALTGWLQQARAERARQVFIVYHKPSFCITGHGPLPESCNPRRFIEPFAKDLSITVFNGHVHTTELYRVNGVRYLVLGGGGAPQKFQAKPPPGYPPELYWRGSPRVEEYNFLLVQVRGKGLRLILHRFRPTQVRRPFSTVEVLAD